MSPTEFSPGFLLGIDTCGPAGSVALGSIDSDGCLQVVEQVELEGRTYSATLVAAIQELLARHKIALAHLRQIVVVKGPGSFTGVRVGLSAAKGLAHGADIGVIAISRLQVLAQAGGCSCAALDAHRHEVFLLRDNKETLAGAADLAGFPAPESAAVCEEAAGILLRKSWPEVALIHVAPPDAAGALRMAVSRIRAGDCEDIDSLDGHYLRRSDAEIFGAKSA